MASTSRLFGLMASSSRRLAVLGAHVAPNGGFTPKLAAGYSSSAASVLATRRQVEVLDSYMSYLDTGNLPNSDETVIFLHGNPTQAYLWRNVIPHVQPHARCIAPDLIGCGHSGKLSSHDYRIKVHYEYLCALFEKLALPQKVTFVIHDWGSALGFHWCNMHRDRVKGIVFMEGVANVMTWDQFPEGGRKAFQNMRGPPGEEMVLKKNFFVERLLPSSVMRKLTAEEMAQYVAPFKNEGEDWRPTLTFPREIPIEGHPKDVHDMVKSYNQWLREDKSVRKLFIDAEPGFFGKYIRKEVAKWPNHRRVTAPGLHFLQEDSPDVIGRAVADFVQSA